ncbi:MAG: sulfite exporter TauE/SafE family protein, partial [Acidobacteriota bacterium]
MATPEKDEIESPDPTELSLVDSDTGTSIRAFRAWQPSKALDSTDEMAKTPPGDDLPQRYEIRESESGRYLRCKEAPGVGVAIDRSFNFSEAEARKLGARVILLDGVGQFGPMVDTGKQLYNLDHHANCLRTFTLATCEQALLMVVKGLELDKGDWKIVANEPDLDTVFAIWVLLNYRRLRTMTGASRDKIAALIRLEGAIDANGFEVASWCGLPTEWLERGRQEIDDLFAIERESKSSGGWDRVDLAEHTRRMLSEIDRLVYRSEDFEDFDSVEEELGHVDIGNDKVAVLCRDDKGIYDVEQRLKKVWNDRLGVIALAKDDRNYTLRRVAALSDIDLELAYDRLNQLDPAVDGRPAEKRWGGSDEIGGSPRPGGSGLAPKEIARVLGRVFRPVDRWRQVERVGLAALLAILIGGAAASVHWLWGFVTVDVTTVADHTLRLAAIGGVMLLAALAFMAVFAEGRWFRFGWRWPAGEDWWWLVPAVLVGGALGG